jgi:hypothetical protein
MNLTDNFSCELVYNNTNNVRALVWTWISNNVVSVDNKNVRMRNTEVSMDICACG